MIEADMNIFAHAGGGPKSLLTVFEVVPKKFKILKHVYKILTIGGYVNTSVWDIL